MGIYTYRLQIGSIARNRQDAYRLFHWEILPSAENNNTIQTVRIGRTQCYLLYAAADPR